MDPQQFTSPLSPVSYSGEKFFSKKNIITLLLVGITLLVIPIGVKMLQEQQFIKIRATGEEITFVPRAGIVACSESEGCTTKETKVDIDLLSLFGEPGDPITPTPTSPPATPTPQQMASPYNLSKTCSGNFVNFSWSAPNVGSTTGYGLRVDRQKNVWTPAACDDQTNLCPGENASGDFVRSVNAPSTNTTIAVVPGERYGWSIQANPHDSGPNEAWNRRTQAGMFSCSSSGTLTQVTPPQAANSDAPRSPIVSCIAGSDTVARARLSWNVPASGTAPTSYSLRVDKQYNVWMPTACTDQVDPCPGEAASGDFTVNATGTTHRAVIVPGDNYNWSVQAAPNSGPFNRRTEGGSFSCGSAPTSTPTSPPASPTPWPPGTYLNQAFLKTDGRNTTNRTCRIDPNLGVVWSECEWNNFDLNDQPEVANSNWTDMASFTFTKGGIDYLSQTFLKNDGRNTANRTCEVKPAGIDWAGCTWNDYDLNNQPRLAGSTFTGISSMTFVREGVTYLNQAFLKTDGRNTTNRTCRIDPNLGVVWSECEWNNFDLNDQPEVANSNWTDMASFTFTKGGIDYLSQTFLKNDGRNTANRTCEVKPAGIDWAGCTWNDYDLNNQPRLAGSTFTGISSMTFVITQASGVAGIMTTALATAGSPTPTPTTKTSFYRISTQEFSGDSGWQRYTGHPQRLEQFDLGSITPGTMVNIFAQFKSDSGTVSQTRRKSIKYIGPDPSISRTACSYSPTGTGTEVIIEGQNFGERGSRSKVMFNGQEARISSWSLVATSSGSMTPTPTGSITPTPTPTGSSGQIWRIAASIRERLQGGAVIPLFIETNERRRAPTEGDATCTINLTTLSFNAKSECRPSGDMAVESIKIKIKESTGSARPIFNQNINLNAEGNPVWTPPVLEVGKKYVVSVRGPKTLGHKVEIEAKEGTNVLDEFKMLIGDIAPVSSPDNRVNTLDYGLLVSQWTIAKDAAKSADFNQDRRVNSIDYACLRQNFNKNGEDFPVD